MKLFQETLSGHRQASETKPSRRNREPSNLSGLKFGNTSILTPGVLQSRDRRLVHVLPVSRVPVVQTAHPRANQVSLLRQGGGDLHQRAVHEVLLLRRPGDQGEEAQLLRLVQVCRPVHGPAGSPERGTRRLVSLLSRQGLSPASLQLAVSSLLGIGIGSITTLGALVTMAIPKAAKDATPTATNTYTNPVWDPASNPGINAPSTPARP